MMRWFEHITNDIATNHWAKTTKTSLPSAHLHIEINLDQYSFPNLTMQDVLLSTLEMDSYGENAKKKRARLFMWMVDGSAKIYSKQLNSAARMEKYIDQNALVGILIPCLNKSKITTTNSIVLVLTSVIPSLILIAYQYQVSKGLFGHLGTVLLLSLIFKLSPKSLRSHRNLTKILPHSRKKN